MSEKSRLTVARPGSKSLKSTVPMGIVKHLNLKDKDELDWEIKIVDGELKVVVSPG